MFLVACARGADDQITRWEGCGCRVVEVVDAIALKGFEATQGNRLTDPRLENPEAFCAWRGREGCVDEKEGRDVPAGEERGSPRLG
jgi:hypothetical protein